MRVAFDQVAGRRTRVLLAGDPAAPAIVLLHGVGTMAERWLRNIEALSAHGQVLAPDLWNNGFSDDLQAGDPAPALAHVQQVVGLLGQRGVRRCVVVGSSYGGQVAALTALAHPELVAGLVVVGSGSALHTPEKQVPVLHAVKANAMQAIEEGTAARIDEAMKFAGLIN